MLQKWSYQSQVCRGASALSRWRLPLMLGIVSRNLTSVKPVKLFSSESLMLETSIQFWLGSASEYWHSHKCHLTQSVGHIHNRIVPHWAWILSRRCARTFCTKPPRSPCSCPVLYNRLLARQTGNFANLDLVESKFWRKYAAQLVCLKKFPNSMSFNPLPHLLILASIPAGLKALFAFDA